MASDRDMSGGHTKDHDGRGKHPAGADERETRRHDHTCQRRNHDQTFASGVEPSTDEDRAQTGRLGDPEKQRECGRRRVEGDRQGREEERKPANGSVDRPLAEGELRELWPTDLHPATLAVMLWCGVMWPRAIERGVRAHREGPDLMAGDGEKPGIAVEFGEGGRSAYASQVGEYRATLARVPDDMWSAFADAAEPGVLLVDGDVVGCVAVSVDGELHRFHVRSGFEHLAGDLFEAVVDSRTVGSMIVSTADPLALSVLAPQAESAMTVSLLFELVSTPTRRRQEKLRVAAQEDRERSGLFVDHATTTASGAGSGYLDERIERGELFLHEVGGEIVAIGERRIDGHDSRYAHLGVIVGTAHRIGGIGTAVLASLIEMSIRDGLVPLCSTEPDNTASRRMIRGAGFTSRHSILRLVPARL